MTSELPPPRWGLGDCAVGIGVALASGSVAASLLIGPDSSSDDLGLIAATLLTMSLWIGYLGAPLISSYFRGNGLVADFALVFRWVDLPVGFVAGLVAQAGAVALTWPISRLFDVDTGESARQVVGRASGAGIVLLVIVVVFVGPMVEELFFRGLLYRSIERRSGTAWAVGGSAVAFGALHFQPYLFAGLTLIGLVTAGLVARFGRLGPAVTAHVAFNGATVAFLLGTA